MKIHSNPKHLGNAATYMKKSLAKINNIEKNELHFFVESKSVTSDNEDENDEVQGFLFGKLK